MVSAQRGGTEPLQEKVYHVIKEKIVSCEMLPGTVINEEMLAPQFGTSRTPIREALQRLHRERFVDIFPRQGTVVSPVSRDDMYELNQLRLFIEPQAVKYSCKKLDLSSVRKLRGFFAGFDLQSGSVAEWHRVDRELHSYIVNSCGNSYLCGMYGAIMDQYHRMRVLSGINSGRLAEATKEHITICDALLSADENAAQDRLAAHIRNDDF